jgi:hypothetical protein
MIVYKVTNLKTNQIYIGQTTKTLEIRKKQHFNSLHLTSPFATALKKYAKEDFVWEVIKECSSLEELNSSEIELIAFYQSTVGDGNYNLAVGGGNFGTHTEESKLKISQSQLGSKNHMFGKRSPTAIQVINMMNRKVYDCIEEAALDSNCNASKVAAVVRGDRIQTNGIVFREFKNEKPVKPKQFTVISQRSFCYNVSTKKLYMSMKLACPVAGYLAKKLSSICDTNEPDRYGNFWKKVDLEDLDEMLISVPSSNIIY